MQFGPRCCSYFSSSAWLSLLFFFLPFRLVAQSVREGVLGLAVLIGFTLKHKLGMKETTLLFWVNIFRIQMSAGETLGSLRE